MSFRVAGAFNNYAQPWAFARLIGAKSPNAWDVANACAGDGILGPCSRNTCVSTFHASIALEFAGK